MRPNRRNCGFSKTPPLFGEAFEGIDPWFGRHAPQEVNTPTEANSYSGAPIIESSELNEDTGLDGTPDEEGDLSFDDYSFTGDNDETLQPADSISPTEPKKPAPGLGGSGPRRGAGLDSPQVLQFSKIQVVPDPAQ